MPVSGAVQSSPWEGKGFSGLCSKGGSEGWSRIVCLPQVKPCLLERSLASPSSIVCFLPLDSPVVDKQCPVGL